MRKDLEARTDHLGPRTEDEPMSVVKRLVQRAIALAGVAAFLLLGALVVNGVASSVSIARLQRATHSRRPSRSTSSSSSGAGRSSASTRSATGVLGRTAPAPPGDRRGQERRRRAGCEPQDRARTWPQGRRDGYPGKDGGRDQGRQGRTSTTRPSRLTLLKLNAVVGVKGFFNSSGQLTSMGINLCPLPLDRRRLVRARDRQAARRLAEP